MPSWKKVITSGSAAALSSLTVTGGITGSLFGTASWAVSSSRATTSSYSLTSSYNVNPTISGSINGADYVDFSTNYIIGTNAPAWKEGRLFYDSGSGGLAFYNWEQDVTLNIGQEQWLRARNQTGVTITNGSVVRLSSAIGDRPTVVLAQSVDQTNNFSTANEIIGMATHDIEHGTDGFITTFGLVNGLNTAAFAAGDLLWVSQSAGQFTNVPPSVPFDKIFVGIVARSNVANGTVFMTPLTSIHFHDLSSVSASAYQQGDIWMYRSGSAGLANAWINTKQLSGSYGITGSLNVSQGITATSFTGSLFGTASVAVSASFASTASFVNTLNQNVLITGSATIASTTAGASENTLTLGPSPAGGTGEGGQLGLNAVGGTYTSASFIDNWQNHIRILRGTNASSDGLIAQWNLQSKQMNLSGYTSPTSIPGTVSGLLAFDTSGNIITTTTGSGGGGGVTINNNVDNYIVTATGTANTLNGESGLQYNGTSLAVTGQVTASGAIISTANGAMYFRGGDDAEFWDINVANTVGIYGQQNADRAGLKLGSSGPTLFGSASRLGIGTTTPTLGTLEVNGNVYATSFTGSLQGTASVASNVVLTVQDSTPVDYNLVFTGLSATGNGSLNMDTTTLKYNPSTTTLTTGTVVANLTGTASWATNAQTASFVTGSNVYGPFGSNSVTSASFAVSSSRAVTSSFATTASFASSVGSISANITNNTDNYLLTATGGSTINGESNLTFNGTLLTVAGQLKQGDSGTSVTGTEAHAEGRGTTASGNHSHAEGYTTVATGLHSHAEGEEVTSLGRSSHAEGYRTLSSASYSHAEGYYTTASGQYSHAEGWRTLSSGSSSHAEGSGSRAIGLVSHAEGWYTLASGISSHAEGFTTTASGDYSHAEGVAAKATGIYSHAEGYNTTAIGGYSHAEGIQAIANNTGAHAEGENTAAQGAASHAEGYITYANASWSHAEGAGSTAAGLYSHAEGEGTTAAGSGCHSEGYSTVANGSWSHAEGYGTYSRGTYSHTEGFGTETGDLLGFRAGDDVSISSGVVTLNASYGDVHTLFAAGNVLLFDDSTGANTYGRIYPLIVTSDFNGSYTVITLQDTSITTSGIAIIGDPSYINNWTGDQEIYGTSAHSEGSSAKAIGLSAHTEGSGSIAAGPFAHAEGYQTYAIGYGSHAEGYGSNTQGNFSHAEGASSKAYGVYSHAEGSGTRTGAFGYNSVSIVSGVITIDTSYGDVKPYIQEMGYITLYDAPFDDAYGTQVFKIDSITGGAAPTIINLIDTSVNTTQAYIGSPGLFQPAGADRLIPGETTHTEGYATSAVNRYGHAEGYNTQAVGFASHAEGLQTVTINSYQHASGEWNLPVEGEGVFMIGNGSSSTTRKNLFLASGSDVVVNGNLLVTDTAVGYGQAVVTGSLRGNVESTPVASNTASLNLASTNFFILSLTNGTTTHINPSNIRPGQTVNVRVTQGSAGTGKLSFNSAIKSGSFYTGSAIANAVDIMTFISFDSSTLYMSAVTNLK